MDDDRMNGIVSTEKNWGKLIYEMDSNSFFSVENDDGRVSFSLKTPPLDFESDWVDNDHTFTAAVRVANAGGVVKDEISVTFVLKDVNEV